MELATITAGLEEHWPIWLVTAILVVAAVIDGWKLKVPNWITLPMIVSGWVYSTWFYGPADWAGAWPARPSGSGLVAPAVRHWRHGCRRRQAAGRRRSLGLGNGHPVFLLPVGRHWRGDCPAMVAYRRGWQKHSQQFVMILDEVTTIRDPVQLSTLAAERKSRCCCFRMGFRSPWERSCTLPAPECCCPKRSEVEGLAGFSTLAAKAGSRPASVGS